MAKYEKRAHRIFYGTDSNRNERIFSAQPLAKHARHSAAYSSGRRTPGIYDSRAYGGHAVAALRHLQRIRAVREQGSAWSRGISRFRKISVQEARLERARKH